MQGKMRVIAALDQGTTSSRTILFDEHGKVVAKAMREFRQIYPRPGWVEHDPRDLLASQLDSFRAALRAGNISPAQVAAVGIANQRETVLVWDRFTGKPVYNAIVWQCRRTSAYCEEIKKEHGERIYARTGLNADAYFSASKIRWILDNVPFARSRAEAGELLFGTVDTFLLWRLTGGKVHATDYTNASRTMLFNIHTLAWDDDLCDLFGIPRRMLPQVFPSGAMYGKTSAELLGAEIPMTMFYTDGYMYTDTMGQKTKQPMEAMEAVAQANSTMSGVEVDLSAMRGMRMHTENGNTVISYTMDPSAMNSIMDSAMMDMSAYDAMGADYQVVINRCEGTMTINSEGYYEAASIYMDMSATISAEGESMDVGYKIDMDMTYNNPGQEVNFEIPSTEGYQEMYALLEEAA